MSSSPRATISPGRWLGQWAHHVEECVEHDRRLFAATVVGVGLVVDGVDTLGG
jgi:hypothetical protein